MIQERFGDDFAWTQIDIVDEISKIYCESTVEYL